MPVAGLNDCSRKHASLGCERRRYGCAVAAAPSLNFSSLRPGSGPGPPRDAMAERLVDVLDGNGRVIHTYPVTLGDSGGVAGEAEYGSKALEAAAHGQLVPDAELAGLSARMHHCRGGRIEPYGDKVSSTSETKLGLEQAVRERAYALWEQEGQSEGRAEEY